MSVKIIESADFIGDVEIPVGEWTEDKLNLYIDQVEEDILTSLLGWTLYQELESNLNVHPLPAKWANLIDGDTYTSGEITFKFKGLTEMLKHFVFFYYMRDNEMENTQIGVVINSATNADRVTPVTSNLLRRHWNKGIKIYNDACSYITITNEPTEVYADFHFTQRDNISIV
jgi:hypothetical protein